MSRIRLRALRPYSIARLRMASAARPVSGAAHSGVQARTRAVDAFGRLRVWDTAANNGVLVYLLLADQRIEIVADRGLAGLVSDEQWRGVCLLMEERLRAGEYADGVVAGIEAVGDLLALHFPQEPGGVDEDELPNQPVFL